jgi:hypothetical protein
MTLNYWMMVERYPNLKEEVGDLIPGFEISSLLDKNYTSKMLGTIFGKLYGFVLENIIS